MTNDPNTPEPSRVPVRDLPVDLDRDSFLRDLIRELSGSLEDVVGLHEAAGFISLVGQSVGEQIERAYREEIGLTRLDRPQVAEVLVDLKRRIQGDFYVIEESEERIVLGNRACPFGDRVKGRPSLCMMTSNVFGTVTAENLGYARVEIERAIANGDAQCRVVVHLKPDEGPPSPGREYFRSDE